MGRPRGPLLRHRALVNRGARAPYAGTLDVLVETDAATISGIRCRIAALLGLDPGTAASARRDAACADLAGGLATTG